MNQLKNFVLTLTALMPLWSSAQNLPDRIQCVYSNSDFRLVLVLRDPQLPIDVGVIGLKKGNTVLFKVASQIQKESDGKLNFTETPSTSLSKQVLFDFESKVATLKNFHRADLPEGSQFSCSF